MPSCLQVASRCLQDGNLTPTWPNLGPTWPHHGSQEAPKRPPRAPQEAPRSSIFNIKISIFCGRGSIFLSYPVACNMSPLGRRRGPALRAESGGGRREVRPEAARCVGLRPEGQGLIPQSWPLAEHQGPTPFRRPLGGQLSPGPISLERGGIFRQVAFMLSSSWPSSAKLPPSCLQDGFRSQLDPNLGPTRPSLGPPEGQSDL